jgi:hypothetical protein
MPAAFYEFTLEQSSDFVSSLKVLNPKTGKLFKFLPDTDTSAAWVPVTNNSNNLKLNFDIPEEIKLLYPDDNDSFGWLKNNIESVPSNNTTAKVLTIRMKAKSSNTSSPIYNTETIYQRLNENGKNTIQKQYILPVNDTNRYFDIRRNNPDHNILMAIPSSATDRTGKYLYDIELEYNLGSGITNSQNTTYQTKPFVVRLLQGRFIFNPNITN